MPLNASLFFTNPAFSLGQVYGQVLNIFRFEWKTFMALSALQFLSFIPYFLLVGVVFALIFGVEALAVASAINQNPGRALSDAVYGNNNYNSYDPPTDDPISGMSGDDFANSSTDDSFASAMALMTAMSFTGSMVVTFIASYIFFIALFVLISSTFQGATIRAVADIYAGSQPAVGASLKVGWKNMWRISCFGLVLSGCYVVFTMVLFGIAVGVYHLTGLTFIFLWFILYAVIITLASSSMIAGQPMIIIEHKSVKEALIGSWNLCKSSLCFIFCSTFCFALLEMICRLLFRLILGGLVSGADQAVAGGILLVSSMLVSLMIVPLNMIIGPVIYFSLRIRITGLTQVELVQQLEDQAAVELQAGAPKYKEVDDEDKTPLAIAVAVDDKSIV